MQNEIENIRQVCKKWIIIIVLLVVVFLSTIIIPLIDWSGKNGIFLLQLTNQVEIKEALEFYSSYVIVNEDATYLVFGINDLSPWFKYTFTHLHIDQIFITVLSEILAITIFIAFSTQGQLNSRVFPERQEAEKLLGKYKIKEYKPISPTKFKAQKYSVKTVCIIISSFCSIYLFSKVIINFDVGTFLGLTTSSLIAFIFGIITMKDFEDYYKYDFIKWARYKVESLNVPTEVENA